MDSIKEALIINYYSHKLHVEDTCNLRGIPAVTCEVLSPFASVGKGSFEKSLEQMKSFLEYFGF